MSTRDSERRRDEIVRAARDTSGPVDTVALEQALVAYREGAATWTEPELVEVVTRRHKVIRALAATTLATKIVLGVATAAAVGGIGVAVTETVHHAPSPAPTSVAPSTPAPESPTRTSTTAPTSSTTPTPTTTVTDTASAGANTSPAPTTSPSRRVTPSGSATGSGSASPTRGGPGQPSPTRTTQNGQGDDGDGQGQNGDGQGQDGQR